MRVVCLSDTHTMGRKVNVPDGDLLIHCGDLTYRGTIIELVPELNWLRDMPHPHKIVIAGNHDFGFEQNIRPALIAGMDGLIYLENEGVEIEGIKIWGSPVQPWFHNWAFQKQRGAQLRDHWARMPDELDILVTHGPPAGYGDMNKYDERFGDMDLLHRVLDVKPKYHVYGHAHHGYGRYENQHTKFINCAVCTEAYQPTNPPIVFEI